jgi:hypothetical protein
MGRNNNDFHAGKNLEGPAQYVTWDGESGATYSFRVPPGSSTKDAGKTIAHYTNVDRSYKNAGIHGQTVEEPVKGSVRWNKND